MPKCDMQHLFCVSKKYFYYLFLTFKVLCNHQKNPLHLYKSFFLRETFFIATLYLIFHLMSKRIIICKLFSIRTNEKKTRTSSSSVALLIFS